MNTASTGVPRRRELDPDHTVVIPDEVGEAVIEAGVSETPHRREVEVRAMNWNLAGRNETVVGGENRSRRYAHCTSSMVPEPAAR
jgi:hypothetical protein